MKRASTFLLVALCIAVPLCAQKSDRHAARTHAAAFTFDGHKRAISLYRPKDVHTFETAPLVVMLGERGDTLDTSGPHHWNQTADANGFLVAYVGAPSAHWSDRGTRAQRDVAYVDAAIHHLIANENADPDRIYLAGDGEAAQMAYRMACESTVSVAAVGAVNGTMFGNCRNPQQTSVIAIHGALNHKLPLDGHGLPLDADYIPSVNTTLLTWRQANTCGRPAIAADEDGVETATFQCQNGRSIARVAVPREGNDWPEASDKRTFDATATLWSFFRQQSATVVARNGVPAPASNADSKRYSGY